jgi:hypothetical protein
MGDLLSISIFTKAGLAGVGTGLGVGDGLGVGLGVGVGLGDATGLRTFLVFVI